jgi:hypothetical protein
VSAEWLPTQLEKCDEGVTRKGEFEPCEKPAVAVRYDQENGGYYAVCGYHTRGMMLTLPGLVAAVLDGSS